MKVGLQIPNFTWPGGPAELASTLSRIARTAEDAGFDSVWVMDHFFQIMGAAEQEMVEAYTTLGSWPARPPASAWARWSPASHTATPAS